MNDVKLLYNPYPKQRMFHDSRAKFRTYSGGVGSGKTLAGIYEALKQSLTFPNNLGLVGRLTYPELDDTTWKELLNFPCIVDDQEVRFIDSPLVINYNKQKHEITLYNRSIILGRALDDSFDKLAKGLNLGWLYVDELTEVPEEIWDGITRLRLRRRVPCFKCGKYPPPGKVICNNCKIYTIRHTAFGTTNPEGHDWVWKKFIMNNDGNYFIVQASSEENPALSEEYLNELRRMPDEWKKRYLYGSFDTFEGLVYKEYQDKEPFVIEPFKIPEHWYRFVGIDHGYRNPTAILYGAVNDEGLIFIYDELYMSGKLVSELAELMKMKEKENKPKLYLIDPSTRNRNGQTGLSVIDEFASKGIYCEPANNDVRAGINHVQECFNLVNGKPRLKIFKNCVNLRTELQTYRWKDIKTGAMQDAPEKPLKKNDHAVDALRYMVINIFQTPKKKPREHFDYKEVLSRVRQTVNYDWMAS